MPRQATQDKIGKNLILQVYAPRLHALFRKSNWKNGKGNFVTLVLTHDKAKGEGLNKPVSFIYDH